MVAEGNEAKVARRCGRAERQSGWKGREVECADSNCFALSLASAFARIPCHWPGAWRGFDLHVYRL